MRGRITAQTKDYPKSSLGRKPARSVFEPRPFAAAYKQAEVSSKGADRPDLLRTYLQRRRIASSLGGSTSSSESSAASNAVQPKLMPGPPGARYGQEADRVAGQVVERVHELRLASTESVGDRADSMSPSGEAAVAGLPVQRAGTRISEPTAEAASSQGVEDAIENRTGMPDLLKAGLEQLSGFDLSSVRVHYNSAKPTHLDALAYTQGQDIEVSPGQERHLPHEGWHAVQQMQGRVEPTMQAQGVSINDDDSLEHEADVMGLKALQMPRPEEAIGPAPVARITDNRAEVAARRTLSSVARNNARVNQIRAHQRMANGGPRVLRRESVPAASHGRISGPHDRISAQNEDLDERRGLQGVRTSQVIQLQPSRNTIRAAAVGAGVATAVVIGLIAVYGRTYAWIWLNARIRGTNLVQNVQDLVTVWNAVPALGIGDILALGTIHAGINGAGLTHIAQNVPGGRTLGDLIQLANGANALTAQEVAQLAGIHAGINVAGLIHIAQNVPGGRTVGDLTQLANNLPLLTAPQVVNLLAAHPGVLIAGVLPAAITGVWTPQDNFGGRSLIHIGVGEQVDLTVNMVPGAIPLASIGGVNWVVAAGNGAIAGVNVAQGTGTFQTNGDASPLQVEAQVAGGTYAGTVLDTLIRASIAPNNVTITNTGTTARRRYPPDAFVEFIGQPYIQPATVSFRGIEEREDEAEADGRGYFVKWNRIVHPLGNWVTVNGGNSAAGSITNSDDTINTGPNTPPFSVGTFTWPIPWNYKAPGIGETQIAILNHEQVMQPDGTLQIRKGGSGWVSN